MRCWGDPGVVSWDEGQGGFHPAAAGTAAAAFGDEEEALGGESAEPAGGAEAGPVGLLFSVLGPEGEADIETAIKEAVAGADGGGAFCFWAVFVVEGFAIGEGDAGGVGVDTVFVNDGVGDVGAVVIGAPRGLRLEEEGSVVEVEVVVAEDALSVVFSFRVGVAFREGGEEALAGHGAVGDLDEAFFFGAEEGFGEGFFPEDFAGGGVEADRKDVVPVVAGGLAARGVFFEIRVAGFEEAEFAFGEGEGGIDDEAAGVGPVAFPSGFRVAKNVVAEDVGGVGIAADFVIPSVAEVFFELGTEPNGGADDGIAFLGDVSPFVTVAVIGGEF